jgi:hypothetical protein
MGKYGTNYTGFGAYEGGVNSDKGAPLVATNSDGETSLLFGAPALREIQAGVANGDFAIPPDNSSDAIGDENPLPYWSLSTTGTGLSATVVTDTSQASGNALRVTVATSASGTLTLTRYIPIPGSRGRTFSLHPIITLGGATNCTDAELYITGQQYDASLTSISSTSVVLSTYQFNSYTATTTKLLPDIDQQTTWNQTSIASNAAFYKITIVVQNAGVPAGNRTIDFYDIRLITGSSDIFIADGTTPSTYGPAWISADSGQLNIQAYPASGNTYQLQVTSTGIGIPGPLTYRGTTGANMILGGTNGRLWSFSNGSDYADVASISTTATSTTRPGVLITKPVAGQPTTNINGTTTTDAFSDALRHGAIAVDTTNNRAYFYSNGWKYAALTTPSDSRLKEEITSISGALDTLRQLVPVAFKWKRPDAHNRAEAVADNGKRLGFIADQVATTDLKHWVETLGVDDREADLIDTPEVLAVNIPQNEMEALVVQALLDIDTRLKALESR